MYVQLLNGPSTFTTDHCNGQLLNDQLLNDQLHYGQILYDQLFTTNYCTDTVYKTTDGMASFSFVIQPCYKTQPTILRIGINRASPTPCPPFSPSPAHTCRGLRSYHLFIIPCLPQSGGRWSGCGSPFSSPCLRTCPWRGGGRTRRLRGWRWPKPRCSSSTGRFVDFAS